MTRERIQKVIAASGLYSRRAVEGLIEGRLVKVNGIVVAQKGVKVDPQEDRIHIDGKAFLFRPERRLLAIAMNKPRQVIVSRSDPQGRKTVYDFLPEEFQKVRPVGRLDFNTQGLLLLTNDGGFLNHLSHPRYHVEKEYHVKLSSHPNDRQLRRLRQGIILDGERTLPIEVNVLRKNRTSMLCQMILSEGRNRQIHQMCAAVGLTVKELKRVRVGPVHLKNLRPGLFRLLSTKEVYQLKKQFKQLK